MQDQPDIALTTTYCRTRSWNLRQFCGNGIVLEGLETDGNLGKERAKLLIHIGAPSPTGGS